LLLWFSSFSTDPSHFAQLKMVPLMNGGFARLDDKGVMVLKNPEMVDLFKSSSKFIQLSFERDFASSPLQKYASCAEKLIHNAFPDPTSSQELFDENLHPSFCCLQPNFAIVSRQFLKLWRMVDQERILNSSKPLIPCLVINGNALLTRNVVYSSIKSSGVMNFPLSFSESDIRLLISVGAVVVADKFFIENIGQDSRGFLKIVDDVSKFHGWVHVSEEARANILPMCKKFLRSKSNRFDSAQLSIMKHWPVFQDHLGRWISCSRQNMWKPELVPASMVNHIGSLVNVPPNDLELYQQIGFQLLSTSTFFGKYAYPYLGKCEELEKTTILETFFSRVGLKEQEKVSVFNRL
jgi:hypothetical protein